MGRRIEPRTVLQHPARLRIYAALATGKPPIAELARSARLKPSSVRWHLDKMKAAGLVTQANGSRQVYRPADADATRLAVALTVLSSRTARDFLAEVIAHPGLHLGALAEQAGTTRSRYWRVAPRLERAGLVAIARRRRAKLLLPTPLGFRALRAFQESGLPPDKRAPRGNASIVPGEKRTPAEQSE